MLQFDGREGPLLSDAERPEYPQLEVPAWYRDAKLGFFVHLGIYSVPAWADDHVTPVTAGDEYARHRYAEWYGNTVRIQHSPARAMHDARFGPGTSYEDLADLWQAKLCDAEALVSTLRAAGGRYIVPTTKHHDGFCLWDTDSTPFNAVRRGPRRDLITEFHAATRAAGLRFGVYFSGALDWHVSDFPPITDDEELFRFRRNDGVFAAYAAAQLRELIERFEPDLLWNDIDWPDAGKRRGDAELAAVLSDYLERVPHGAVNDRWGVPARGFLTREYEAEHIAIDAAWEATRGIGLSFGHNTQELPEERLDGADAVRLLVDVVAKNGNLLLNVGPQADGTLPEEQLRVLEALGAWLGTNGEAIYGTKPAGIHDEDGRFVATESDDTLYLHVTTPSDGTVVVPSGMSTTNARWLGGEAAASSSDGIEIPAQLRDAPVAVLAIPRVGDPA